MKVKLSEDSEIALGVDLVNAGQEQRLNLAIHDLRMSMSVLEMSVLISGTLVRGFCDIINICIYAYIVSPRE